MLTAIPNQLVHAGMAVVISNSVSDPDLPVNTLAFSLLPGAPGSASIDPNSGLFSWLTTDADVNTTNQVTVHVHDNGVPLLADEKSFIITVISRPVVQSIVMSNQAVTIRWSAIAGRRYRLQAQAEAGTEGWIHVTPDILAEGASSTVTLPAVEGDRFYRVHCRP